MRASERWEGVVRILAAMLVLAAIPLSVWAGQAHYSSVLARVRADMASVTVVMATVTQRPVSVGRADGMSPDTSQAQVSWQRAGRPDVAVVEVPVTAAPGDRLPLRLGRDGRPLPDMSPSDVAMGYGFDRGSEVFGAAAAATVVLLVAAGRWFEHRHRLEWAREWSALNCTAKRG